MQRPGLTVIAKPLFLANIARKRRNRKRWPTHAFCVKHDASICGKRERPGHTTAVEVQRSDREAAR